MTSLSVCVCGVLCSQTPEVAGFPGDGVSDGFEVPDMRVRN